MVNFSFLIILSIVCCSNAAFSKIDCELAPELEEEIQSYSTIAQTIIDATLSGRFKGSTYNVLAEFADKFGARLTGSEALEKSIDYMLEKSEEQLMDNVHGEEIEAPHWIRGDAKATLISPRIQDLPVLALGSSIGTPPEGIEAEAIVVASFEELDQLPEGFVSGKIVVYNQEWQGYGQSVQYRGEGASRASQLGAVAALVRSVTQFSLGTLHTGWQVYDANVTKIPVASITVEDANLLHRMYAREERIVINLLLTSENLPPCITRNAVAEISGTSEPEKVIFVSGHIDSWDVGQGVMDDAGGAILSWNAMAILKQLNLIPKRTIRTILWVAEEQGLVGAEAYYQAHLDEVENTIFVMESDGGTFNPLGLSVAGTDETTCIVQKILNLLESVNTTSLEPVSSVGPDISYWSDAGVPGAVLLHDSKNYFWFHHSSGDSMDLESPEELDKSTAMWATVAYVIADLSIDLPKA